VSEAGYRSALARSGEEIVAATAIHTVPPLNMLWADAQGNIGYQLAGKIPLRRGGVADMPRPGWSGEFEWEGTVPFEDLPQLVNPPAGFIVTANNRIVGDDHPHHITSEWMTGYRATRIEQMLGERERHSVADFERMQHDFVSLPGIETAHRLARLGGASQRARRAVERLRSWDGTLGPDSVAGSIYQAFTVEFARAVIVAATADEALVERYLNKSALALFDVVSSPWRFQERLLSLWEEGNPDWFATAARPQGRSWDEVALESLERGLDALERRFGRDPDGWRWGRVHPVEFQHPMGTVNPILRRVFNRSVEAGGASETVTQNGYLPTDPFRCVWGPVYRMIADLGDPGRSRWQLTTGQSGHPASPHYDDMIDGWLHGHTHPVHAGEREARAAGGAHTLRLDPD
jgi:penicillin amidase